MSEQIRKHKKGRTIPIVLVVLVLLTGVGFLYAYLMKGTDTEQDGVWKATVEISAAETRMPVHLTLVISEGGYAFDADEYIFLSDLDNWEKERSAEKAEELRASVRDQAAAAGLTLTPELEEDCVLALTDGCAPEDYFCRQIRDAVDAEHLLDGFKSTGTVEIRGSFLIFTDTKTGQVYRYAFERDGENMTIFGFIGGNTNPSVYQNESPDIRFHLSN